MTVFCPTGATSALAPRHPKLALHVLIAVLPACALPAYEAPGGSGWRDVAAGWHNLSCAVAASGDAKCWGFDATRFVARLPPGEYVKVDAGGVVCAITPEGGVVCEDGSPTLPRPAVDLSIGGEFGCALDADGAPMCWGVEYVTEEGTPAAEFVSVGAGNGFACGVSPQGDPLCWGPAHAEVSVPLEKMTRVAAAGERLCGILTTGALVCGSEEEQGRLPRGEFVGLDISPDPSGWACGIERDGTVRCGPDANPAFDGTDMVWSDAQGFVEIAVGGLSACALSTDGRVRCEAFPYTGG